DKVREQSLIDLNWGPQSEHAQFLAEHINANGGINGRSIEIIPLAFDPVDASSAQSACLQLTEDNEVFAVLGALRGDEVLCYTAQHDTIAVANADMTQERLDRSTAPYVSVNAARERIIESLVDEASAAGLFDGRTVAVLSTDAIEVATDVAIPALNDAGVSVEFESLTQGDGTVGGAGAELAVNVESMRARGVDTVVVVGDATIPVNTFIGEGFFPTLIFTDQGSVTAVAGRADLSGFDGVYSYGGTTPSDRFANPQFQEDCAAPWNDLNPDRATQDPAAVDTGEPNHTIGLLIACRSLTVFTEAAEAAGTNLNNATFAAALDGLGEFALPGTQAASISEGKYDAEDELRLSVYNPDAADDEAAFVEFTG
ncbi:MAG: ABC transporter substrate-binding protein, partial [Ilumatobacter sp.]|nr:ABC transporter substrate-binding protein [Ilumatobacter sp.]